MASRIQRNEMQMNLSRRQTLQVAGSAGLYAALVGVGLLRPGLAAAQAAPGAFQAKTLAEALRALGAASPADSKDVVISAPDIAENGTVVPVTVRSSLPRIETIALLIEKNPQPLAASYEVLAGMEPEVGTRIKMGQSSDVVALVKADGKFYMTRKEIKITLGGCGG